MAKPRVKPRPSKHLLDHNLGKVPDLSERLVRAFATGKRMDTQLSASDGELLFEALSMHLARLIVNPIRLAEEQSKQWQRSLEFWSDIQDTWFKNAFWFRPDAGSDAEKKPSDRRFKHDLWENNPFYEHIKKNYLHTVNAIEETVGQIDGLSEHKQRRLTYFTQQILDLIAPTNFLATNPEALMKAIDTNGQSLVDGLENLVTDVEANKENISVRLTDPNAFELGKNIATTPGSVIFQNDMFQLIQYAPATAEVYEVPLLIVPPCINKYYILDLKPQNSFIRFALEKGHQVFVVSWVNPNEQHADAGIDTYVEDGILTAIKCVKSRTRQSRINTVGYCIGGTFLTIALAHLARIGDDSVRSATFFTTLTDFEEPGELGVFINDDFLSDLEGDAEDKGYLDGAHLARTFSFLRSNDLVYGPAVRSYLLGEAPPVFDLLYWNSDSTHLARRMSREYLRQLYQDNRFANGEFELAGAKLDMSDIKTPIFVVATKSDHIAPWKSSFIGLNRTSGRKTFVLAESGHIAGIVNANRKSKYGHWINSSRMTSPQSWLKGAKRHDGTWWYRWQSWLARQSGDKRRAPQLRASKRWPIIEPAPGSYVRVGADKL